MQTGIQPDYWWSSEQWCDISLDESGMIFRLLYFGSLRAGSNPLHKHRMRQQFHHQLSILWGSVPFLTDLGETSVKYRDPATGKDQEVTHIEKLARENTRKEFRFVPLISKEFGLACKVDVLLLRRDEPGVLPTIGGDIDNRFKTLLDALKMPSSDELPPNVAPEEGENPFFCLLEDDGLLTDFRVSSDRLLRSWDLPMAHDTSRKIITDAAGDLYQRIVEGLQVPDRKTWNQQLYERIEQQCERQKVEHEVIAVITVTPLIADPRIGLVELVLGI